MLRRCSRIGSAIIAGRVACVNRSQSGHWLYWLHGCPRNIIAKRPQQRSTHRDAWIVTTRTSVTKRIERWKSQYSRKPWISVWRTKDLKTWQRRMGIEIRDRRGQKQQEALIEMHWYWGCMTWRDSWADWASFDEIDCPIYIQSIRPHRFSASYTHFTIIVKKYHCSPHDSQHSHFTNDTCDHHKVWTEPWRLSTLMFPQTVTIIDVCFLAQQPSVQSWAGACFVWAHRIGPTNKCVIDHRTAQHGSGARVLSGSPKWFTRWCIAHQVWELCCVLLHAEVKNSGMATFEGDIFSSFRISPQGMATRTAGGSDESDRVSRKRWSTSWANDWSCSIAVRQRARSWCRMNVSTCLQAGTC